MPAEANWAGNLTYRAAAVHHPATVAQVRDLVARPVGAGLPERPGA